MDEEIPVRHETYDNTPCVGRDCKFWGGEYEDVHHYPAGYGSDHKWHKESIFIWHGEHCNIVEKIAQIRKEIYDRADKASAEVYLSGKYKRPWKKASEEFRKIADEWINLKCPFYEKIGDN